MKYKSHTNNKGVVNHHLMPYTIIPDDLLCKWFLSNCQARSKPWFIDGHMLDLFLWRRLLWDEKHPVLNVPLMLFWAAGVKRSRAVMQIKGRRRGRNTTNFVSKYKCFQFFFLIFSKVNPNVFFSAALLFNFLLQNQTTTNGFSRKRPRLRQHIYWQLALQHKDYLIFLPLRDNTTAWGFHSPMTAPGSSLSTMSVR